MLSNVASRLYFKPVWGQSLYAKGEPIATRSIAADVDAKAELGVPIGSNRMAPQQFGSSIAYAALFDIAFGFEVELVIRITDPALGIVGDRVPTAGMNALQAIHQEGTEGMHIGHHQCAGVLLGIRAGIERVAIGIAMGVSCIRRRRRTGAHIHAPHVHSTVVHAGVIHCPMIHWHRGTGGAPVHGIHAVHGGHCWLRG